MTLTQTHKDMLIKFGQFSRNAQFFTSNDKASMGLDPRIVQRKLNDLERIGYIARIKTGYKLTLAGRHFMDGPGAAVSERVTNAGQRETYRPGPWLVRDGADQHFQFKSRGNPV